MLFSSSNCNTVVSSKNINKSNKYWGINHQLEIELNFEEKSEAFIFDYGLNFWKHIEDFFIYCDRA